MTLRSVLLVGDVLGLRIGLRCRATIDLRDVAEAREVSWREQPRAERAYLNAAKPGDANVVLSFRQPTGVTSVFGIRRVVTRVGIRLDAPGEFVAAVRAHRPG